MTVAMRFLLVFTLIFYCFAYSWLDGNMQERPATLQAAPPLKLLQAVSGYLRQINSEMMFVQTSVFLGGLKQGVDESEYEVSLAHNLGITASLNPEFIDPYYFTNAFLAPISKYGGEQAALILKTGINALPNDFILRFFSGANYFYNLEQADKAADTFAKAAKLEDAPPIFAHLAAIFSAHGGNLKAGLIMLHTMLKTEENEIAKKRYVDEITCFKQAIAIQNAVVLYTQKQGSPPEILERLVPDYLVELPEINEKLFEMEYTPPTVSLKRPHAPKNIH